MEPMLNYADCWVDLVTKDANFEGLLKADDAEGKELLQSLASLRRLACMPSRTTPIEASHAECARQYLLELYALMLKVEPEGVPCPGLRTEWTSPVGARPGMSATWPFKLSGVATELAMSGFCAAAALREQAAQAVRAHPDNPTSVAGAVTALRRAAGLHEWLVLAVLPRVALHAPPIENRPAELTVSIGQVMVQVCLAEAQALLAIRAGQRTCKPGLVSSLHKASFLFWEAAARILRVRQDEYKSLSERLKKWVAIGSALSKARAMRWHARHLSFELFNAGQGCRCCLEAASVLRMAVAASDQDVAWRPILTAESNLLELTRAEIDKERMQVQLQSIADSAPPLPAGKALATPLPYPLSPVEASPGESPEGDATTAPTVPAADSVAAALNRSLSLR